uniref:BtrT n=1 Tax=Niallia circulans TaxID=1397 RepID=Q4H4G1_NIACI|nr:BtrT [Niallia circulans]
MQAIGSTLSEMNLCSGVLRIKTLHIMRGTIRANFLPFIVIKCRLGYRQAIGTKEAEENDPVVSSVLFVVTQALFPAK